MSRVYCNNCMKELGLKKDNKLMTLYAGMQCHRCGKVLIEEIDGKMKYNW